MILRELRITNFRQITGTYTIRFAPPGDHSVTLILGENGSGKTTFLNACLWCLYGRKDFENPGEIISHKAVEATPVGQEVKSNVRLILESGGQTYTIERSAGLCKLQDGRLDDADTEKLNVDVTDEKGVTRSINDRDPHQEIGLLLPEELAGFFFFRGEDLEELVAQAGSDKLKGAVETFVDLLVLDRSIAHLVDVERNLERDLKEVSSGDAKRLTEEVEELQSDMDSLSAKIAEERQQEKKILQLVEEVEDRLAEIEEVRPLVEKRRELDQKLGYLVERIKEKRGELADRISADGYLHLRSDVLSVGVKLASEARKSGEIPAKIKPQFVDDLLGIGVCICGKSIDEEARRSLAEWRNTSALGALETAITHLGGEIAHLQRRKDMFRDDFDQRRIEISELESALEITEAERSRVEGELRGRDFRQESARDLQAAKNRHDSELHEVRLRISRAEDKLAQQEETLEQRRTERDRCAKDQEKESRISRQIQAATNVRKGLQKLRTGWVALVQENLDHELQLKWDEIAQLPRRVQFDSDFRLSIKELGGDNQWRPSASSSANKRALALAFVTSLIKLADQAQGSRDGKRFLFAGGQYPLVMDAPFATMDSFKRTVPVGLRRTVPQIVLVTNYDQRQGEVEDALGIAVGSAYVLTLHTPKETGETINFRGIPVEYVAAEPDTVFDWSELKEIMP
jgi:DNA sulfur modification protein DndD